MEATYSRLSDIIKQERPSKLPSHEETNTGIVFFDDGKIIAKYFNKTTGKLRVTDKGLTSEQLSYINNVIN